MDVKARWVKPIGWDSVFGNVHLYSLPLMWQKKSLGQHFLTDPSIAERIAAAIESTRVMEVGPGKGILTGALLARPGIDLFVVELDDRFAALLGNRWPQLEGRIINQDVL